jgi:hypothetical protein
MSARLTNVPWDRSAACIFAASITCQHRKVSLQYYTVEYCGVPYPSIGCPTVLLSTLKYH